MAVKRTKRARSQSIGDVFAEVGRAPRHRLPDDEMDPEVAYQIVHDELMLDGNARLNLATFVGTWVEPRALRLMTETFDKNMINKDEYPQTAEMEMRCVDMISRLWHAPDPEEAPGCSTTGSSEAAMLGGLALKRRWQEARRAAGKPIDRPNITFPANREDLAVLRVVVKRGFTHDVAGLFVNDLRRQLPRLERQPVPVGDPATGSGFRH